MALASRRMLRPQCTNAPSESATPKSGREDRKLHVANVYRLDGTLQHTLDHGSLVGRSGICRLPETTVGGSPGYVNPRRPLSLCDACGAIQSSQGLNETKAATSGEDKVVKVSSLLSSTAVSIFMIPVGRSGNCHQASSCTRLQQTRRCGLACRL